MGRLAGTVLAQTVSVNPHASDWWGRTALYLAVDMNTFTTPAGDERTRAQSTTAMDIVNALLAADVEVNAQLNFHRPGRGGNTERDTR